MKRYLHSGGLAEELSELSLGGLEGQVSNKDLVAILLDVSLGCGILAHCSGTGRIWGGGGGVLKGGTGGTKGGQKKRTEGMKFL